MGILGQGVVCVRLVSPDLGHPILSGRDVPRPRDPERNGRLGSISGLGASDCESEEFFGQTSQI